MKKFELDNEPKITSGFTTPEGYFSGLTEQLMQQLPKEDKARILPLYKKPSVWLSGIAAVFILVFSLTLFFKSGTEPAQPDAVAIENYLVYQSNLSPYDLVQELDDNDLNELEKSIAISDDAIESYFDAYGNDTYLNE